LIPLGAERFHRRTRIVSRHGIPRGSGNSQTQNPKIYEMAGKASKSPVKRTRFKTGSRVE
jgi:hypothetical protein